MSVGKTYTVKQVAQALDFSTNTVYKYLDQGKIKATRLGKEGRFRIPEEEIIRLLGIKGENPQLAPALGEPESQTTSDSSVIPANAEIQLNNEGGDDKEGYEEKLALLTKVSNPDLFDWFLALTAIFVGVAYLLFPLHHQSILLEPYRGWLLLLKVALIIFGASLLAVDVFVPAKRLHYHLVIRIPLALCFLGLTYVFYLSGSLWTSSYFIVLAVFTLIPLIFKHHPLVKFFLFVYVLTVFSGIIWAKNPTPYFFADIRDFIKAYPGLFEVLLTVGSTVVLGMLVYGRVRSRPVLALTSYFVGGLFFLIAVNFVNDQAWNKAVVALLISSFSFVIPFAEQFDSLSKFSRKDVLISFSWLILILLVGIAVIFYTQTSYKAFVLQESQKRVETAAKLVDAYVSDGVKYVNSSAQNKELSGLLSATKKDSKALEELTKSMFSGATTLKRMAIVDLEGKTLAVYPYADKAGLNVDISDREYFKQVKLTKKTVISEALLGRFSNTTTVVIAAPVLDEKGEFKGMVAGGIDTASLEEKLGTLEFGTTGKLALADQKKTFIIHPNRELIGQTIKINSKLAAAVLGQSGQQEGYSEEGILSLQAYAPVKSLGWGIVAQQPVSEALIQSSIISFTIFLVTILSGVGTLLATVYLKRRKL